MNDDKHATIAQQISSIAADCLEKKWGNAAVNRGGRGAINNLPHAHLNDSCSFCEAAKKVAWYNDDPTCDNCLCPLNICGWDKRVESAMTVLLLKFPGRLRLDFIPISDLDPIRKLFREAVENPAKAYGIPWWRLHENV